MYFHQFFLFTFRRVDRYFHDQMKTFVAVFLWIFNVILYPDDLDILLHFQGFCNLVKLILKRTDYTDADEIFQIFSGCLEILSALFIRLVI